LVFLNWTPRRTSARKSVRRALITEGEEGGEGEGGRDLGWTFFFFLLEDLFLNWTPRRISVSKLERKTLITGVAEGGGGGGGKGAGGGRGGGGGPGWEEEDLEDEAGIDWEWSASDSCAAGDRQMAHIELEPSL